MTKRREPATIEDTLRRVLGTLSSERCAELTGHSRGYLNSLTDEDSRYHLTLRDALILDLEHQTVDGTTPLHDVYADQLDNAQVGRFACKTALARATAAASAEFGDAVRALILAAAVDSCIEQKHDALREWEEALVALRQIEPFLRALIALPRPEPPP